MKLIHLIFGLTAIFIFSNSQANDTEFEACREKLIKAQKLDVLYDLQWNGRSRPKVVVGKTFFALPVDAKEGFAETVNCFLMGGAREKFIDFEVSHWQTGKPAGAFKYGRYKHY